jgi:hypothetical protein
MNIIYRKRITALTNIWTKQANNHDHYSEQGW